MMCTPSKRTANCVHLVRLNGIDGVRGNGQAMNERCVAVTKAAAIYKRTR